MLDIPVRVKDALRDGRLLKNYNIVVLSDNTNDKAYLKITQLSSTNYPITESDYYSLGDSDEGPWYSCDVEIEYPDGTTMGSEYGLDAYIPKGSYVRNNRGTAYLYKEIQGTTVIDNDYLVTESVKFDERMCSGDKFKFGLCEGTALEFEYFNKPDISGKRLQVLLDVQYINENGDLDWHRNIPMGFFSVSKCVRQFSTGIYKVTAFNKLKSEYLDSKANDHLLTSYDTLAGYSHIYNIRWGLLMEEALKTYSIHQFKSCELSYDGTDGIIFRYGFSNPSGTAQFIGIPDNWVGQGYGKLRVRGAATLYNTVAQVVGGAIGLYLFGIRITNSSNTTWDVTFDENTTNDFETELAGDISSIMLMVPVSNETDSEAIKRVADEFVRGAINEGLRIEYYYNRVDGLGDAVVSRATLESLPDVTFRQLQSAIFESAVAFGRLDRVTDLFSAKYMSLNTRYTGLVPSNTTYPADSLYPLGQYEKTVKSGYSKLWTENDNVKMWRNLILTYKAVQDGEEVDVTESHVIDPAGTTDYVMDDNWLLRNVQFDSDVIGGLIEMMTQKLSAIEWFPFELWCAGLPYIETGDAIEIVDENGASHISYVLERQLNGIQNLQDTYINGTLDIF